MAWPSAGRELTASLDGDTLSVTNTRTFVSSNNLMLSKPSLNRLPNKLAETTNVFYGLGRGHPSGPPRRPRAWVVPGIRSPEEPQCGLDEEPGGAPA